MINAIDQILSQLVGLKIRVQSRWSQLELSELFSEIRLANILVYEPCLERKT